MLYQRCCSFVVVGLYPLVAGNRAHEGFLCVLICLVCGFQDAIEGSVPSSRGPSEQKPQCDRAGVQRGGKAAWDVGGYYFLLVYAAKNSGQAR